MRNEDLLQELERLNMMMTQVKEEKEQTMKVQRSKE
jgi:hypothetical protein